MFTSPFEELSVFEKSATIALYLTVALIILGIIVALLVKKFKPEVEKKFATMGGGFVVGYSIGLLGILFYLKFDEYNAAGYIETASFVPIAVLIGTVLILAVAGFAVSIFKKEKLPLFGKIAAGIVGALLVAFLVYKLVVRYEEAVTDKVGEILLYVFTALIVAAITALVLVFGKKQKANDTKAIVYGAVSVAMSFALSYIRFLELPQGGSITFASLLPLMIYACMFGVRRGVVVGGIYGLLQFVQAPWFMHPVQFLLDYPIAFCAVGLSAILYERNVFGNKKSLAFALGALIAAVVRYAAHVVSGIFVFGSGDPENYGAVAWSFLYNSFVFADVAISIVAGALLFTSRTFNKLISSVNNN